MTDAEFVSAFETCELPPEAFHHRDHIRLAWVYWNWYGEAAGARIATAIRRYATHLGKAEKYHETVTQAWMRLVADRAGATYDETIALHPELLDKNLLSHYYSSEILQSEAARARFVAPDRAALGGIPSGVVK
jgi:hypothetical protein